MNSIKNEKFYKFEDLDFNLLNVTSNTKKKRFAELAYDKKPLVISLPSLRIPYDINLNNYSLEVSLSLSGKETLIKKVRELDDYIKNLAISKKWFEDENYCYYPTLKESSNYPPTLKFKINKKDGEILTNFYDTDKSKLQITTDSEVVDLLKKNTNIVTLVDCIGIWFGDIKQKKSFGLVWKLIQLKISTKKEEFVKPTDYLFESSDSEEEYMFQD